MVFVHPVSSNSCYFMTVDPNCLGPVGYLGFPFRNDKAAFCVFDFNPTISMVMVFLATFKALNSSQVTGRRRSISSPQ